MFMDVGESCFSEYGKGCDFGLQIRVHILRNDSIVGASFFSENGEGCDFESKYLSQRFQYY